MLGGGRLIDGFIAVVAAIEILNYAAWDIFFISTRL